MNHSRGGYPARRSRRIVRWHVFPDKERQIMRSTWLYRLSILAALLLASGAGLKW
jgi:hypothetical protein